MNHETFVNQDPYFRSGSVYTINNNNEGLYIANVILGLDVENIEDNDSHQFLE